MTSRAHKVKLGIFLIGGGIAFVIMLGVFAGMRVWEQYDRYHLIVDGSVEGITEGSVVKLLGVPVGAVSRVAILNGSRVRVDLQVREDTALHEGATAYLTHRGVTGEKFVNIQGGQAGKPVIEPGSRLPHGKTALDLLEGKATVLLGTASDLIASTDELVENLATISQNIDVDEMNEVVLQASRTMAELRKASEGLRAMVQSSREPLRDTLAGVHRTTEQMSELTGDVERVLAHLDDVVLQMRSVVRTNEDELRATSENLRDATRSFKQLGRELRAKPSRLLFGRSRRERELPDD